MRGALDRRVLAAISQVRFYCNAGRGRGRAAGAPPKSPASPGLGHGAGVPAAPGAPTPASSPGRGRSSGTGAAPNPIGKSSSSAPAVTKARAKPDSPPAKNAAPVGDAGAGENPKKSPAASKMKAPAPQEAPAGAMHGASQVPAAASEMFSALIQACVTRGLVHEIDYVYSAMQAAHIPANMQTYQSLLQVYIQLGNVQKMDGIYMEMREIRAGQQKPEAPPQEKTRASEMLGALITSWHSRGHFVEVDLAYRGVKLSNLPVPLQSYGAVMDSYNRLGDYGAASAVYEEMRSAMASSAPQPGLSHPVRPPVQPAQPAQPVVQPYQPVVQPSQPMAQPVQPGAPRVVQPGQPPAAQGFQVPGQQPQFTSYPPLPPQHPGVYQPGYPPPPPSPYQQYYSGYYAPQASPYVGMQPGMQPGIVVFDPQTQTYHQAVYPAYQPGYPGAYPGGAPGYPPAYPVQYQAPPPPPPHAPPPPPRPVVSTQQVPVAPSAPVRPETGPKLELQPRALELLQKSNLLKEAEDRAALLKGRHPGAQAQVQVHPPLQQVSAPMGGVQYAPPQYAPPNVYVAPPPQVPLRPPVSGYPVHPGVRVPVPAQVPGQVPVQVPIQILKPVATKPAAAAVEPEAPPEEVSPPVADTKPAIKVSPPVAVTKKPAIKVVADTKKPAMKVSPPVAKPEVKVSPSTKPALKAPDVKPAATVVRPKLPDVKQRVDPVAAAEAKVVPEVKPEPESAPPAESKPATEQPPSPGKLKLGLKEKKGEAPVKLKLGLKEKKEAAPTTPPPPPAAAAASPELKPEAKEPELPSLKLGVAGRGKASDEAPELPKSPSLQLGLKKKQQAKEPEESSPKAEGDSPKPPSLRLGLKKQAGVAKPAEEPADEASDASETETEASLPRALPSLRRMTARGRGKGVAPSFDPLASIIGVHTPADALLQQDGLVPGAVEEDLNLPALPFERRATSQGRGKVISPAELAAMAADQERLKIKREEAAARAIAILESGLGKSQMSIYLERRKKRFSDQQFTLGELSPRQASAPRKAKDPKQKAAVGKIDVDGALEYIAPEEFMEKGDDDLSEVEFALKGVLHRHFLLDVDPQAAMEEFGTNPDIDDKPPLTLEQSLEEAKEELMAQDGIHEKEWEEAVEDIKLRAPQLESLAKRYAGPVRKSGKQNNEELHKIVAKLPPFVSPELAAFTKRAMYTLQNNPGWGAREKKHTLNRLVLDAQHAPTSSTS